MQWTDGVPVVHHIGKQPHYSLSAEAMESGTVIVREVSEEGIIHELLAENGGDQPVLFVEGEELRGAKQDRAVDAHHTNRIQEQRGHFRHMHRMGSVVCTPRHSSSQAFTSHRPFGGCSMTKMTMWLEIHRRHEAMRVSSRNGRSVRRGGCAP